MKCAKQNSGQGLRSRPRNAGAIHGVWGSATASESAMGYAGFAGGVHRALLAS